jgi:hypothetical protein|tara:strand:- start:3803 stop:4138 length:336 start_codon:yes stop_codon:yes gene_type:complete
MKNIIFLTISLLFATSCDSTKSTVSGIENQAFLLIVGTHTNYPNGVEVTLDGKTKFMAEVHKNVSSTLYKNKRMYGVSTGRHDISIKHNDKLLYTKQIFITSQQTKKIVLP